MAAPQIITAPPQTLLALANTWTRKQIITPAANESALQVTGFSLTSTNVASIIDLAGTWNVGTTVETAIKLNITDTASGATSLLMDLQIGGASKLTISKSGQVQTAGASGPGTPDYRLAAGNNGLYGYGSGSNGVAIAVAGGSWLSLGRQASTMLVNSAVAFAWANTNSADGSSSADTGFARKAAKIIEINSGTAGAYPGAALSLGSQTVAQLTAAATAGAGATAFVSDALAPTFGSTVTGGGAVKIPVYSDGSGWLVG